MFIHKVIVKRNEYGEFQMSIAISDKVVVTTTLTLAEAQKLSIDLEELFKG